MEEIHNNTGRIIMRIGKKILSMLKRLMDIMKNKNLSLILDIVIIIALRISIYSGASTWLWLPIAIFSLDITVIILTWGKE